MKKTTENKSKKVETKAVSKSVGAKKVTTKADYTPIVVAKKVAAPKITLTLAQANSIQNMLNKFGKSSKFLSNKINSVKVA
jgi:hypothetical protein